MLIIKNDEECVIKNKYKKLKIRKRAPNCVQKNIRYAASIQRLVFAYLYKIKKDGSNNISYAKKKIITESVKNKIEPDIRINTQYKIKKVISFKLYDRQNKIDNIVIKMNMYMNGK